MSLEALIQENTAAVRELTAVLAKQSMIATNAGGRLAEAAANAAVEKAAGKSAGTTESPAPPPATAQPAAAAEAKEAPSAKPLDYEALKTAFLALCKAKGADVGRSVLAEFGIARLPEAKVEQYAAVKGAIDKVME